jgi:hypothetical protein
MGQSKEFCFGLFLLFDPFIVYLFILFIYFFIHSFLHSFIVMLEIKFKASALPLHPVPYLTLFIVDKWLREILLLDQQHHTVVVTKLEFKFGI